MQRRKTSIIPNQPDSREISARTTNPAAAGTARPPSSAYLFTTLQGECDDSCNRRSTDQQNLSNQHHQNNSVDLKRAAKEKQRTEKNHYRDLSRDEFSRSRRRRAASRRVANISGGRYLSSIAFISGKKFSAPISWTNSKASAMFFRRSLPSFHKDCIAADKAISNPQNRCSSSQESINKLNWRSENFLSGSSRNKQSSRQSVDPISGQYRMAFPLSTFNLANTAGGGNV